MWRTFGIVLILWAALVGCRQQDLHLKVTFDRTEGLTAADPVILKGRTIGEVLSVSLHKGGSYTAQVVIGAEWAEAATENARFWIVDDPDREGRKALEMTVEKGGGKPLEDGAVVAGAVKPSRFPRIWEDLGAQFEDLAERFERFTDRLPELPDEKDLEKLEKELEKLLERSKRAGRRVREKVARDIIPRLKEDLERLRKRLERYGREEDLKPLEKQMEGVKEI